MLVPLPFRYSKAMSGYASTLELLLGMTRSKAELRYIYTVYLDVHLLKTCVLCCARARMPHCPLRLDLGTNTLPFL